MTIYADASTDFDSQLDLIPHYCLYPEMRVWVGRNFASRHIQLLVVGESHYMPDTCTVHHDPIAWYSGVEIPAGAHDWLRTRGVIQNGIETRWNTKSKTIYRNIEAAIVTSGIFPDTPRSVFSEIAFFNFFQRPAESLGASVRVSKADREMACMVFQEVVGTIKPTAVAFTSTLASNHAKAGGLSDFLKAKGIVYVTTAHPSSAWWNRPSRPHGCRTGRQCLVDFLVATAPTA